MESLDEPWFPDARVKTAITILERCSADTARAENIVRFVRFIKPVGFILGERSHRNESSRQNAVEELRKRILVTTPPTRRESMAQYSDDRLRVIAVRQSDLWKEGVKAWELLQKRHVEVDESEDESEEEMESERVADVTSELVGMPDYAAGKWGRFLRAPDFYFWLKKNYGSGFIRLGEIADVRRGITSGCDAFFMPYDVTEEVLSKMSSGLLWLNVGLLTNCKLKEVEDGEVRIIRAGDNTLHPIESKFVRSEVHSLMQVDRPIVNKSECSRVVLWVDKDLSDIPKTYAAKYIRWGAKQTFASKKSKAVRVPERSTCAARPRWYDLTTAHMGVAFWPMAQKYRHIVPSNPDGLVCNHNLFYVLPYSLKQTENAALVGVLNSTIVSLFKHFYGRYAGAEGTLKTEVIDTVLLELPDPRGVSSKITERICASLDSMTKRDITHLVEDRMLQCHSSKRMREILESPSEMPLELQQQDRRDLDDAVFEMIGVSSARQRQDLIEELYRQTAEYYRYQRTQDIQAMENRAKTRGQIGPQDLAASIWDSLTDNEKGKPITEWIAMRWPSALPVEIPDGKATAYGAIDMYEPSSVIFKQGISSLKRTYANPNQAELVAALAALEIRGHVILPLSETDCELCLTRIQDVLGKAEIRFSELSESRTGHKSTRDKVTMMLMQWFTHGRK